MEYRYVTDVRCVPVCCGLVFFSRYRNAQVTNCYVSRLLAGAGAVIIGIITGTLGLSPAIVKIVGSDRPRTMLANL